MRWPNYYDNFHDHDDTFDDDNDDGENNEESNDGGDSSLKNRSDEILYRRRTTPDGPHRGGTQKQLSRSRAPGEETHLLGQKTHKRRRTTAVPLGTLRYFYVQFGTLVI